MLPVSNCSFVRSLSHLLTTQHVPPLFLVNEAKTKKLDILATASFSSRFKKDILRKAFYRNMFPKIY